MAGGFLRRLGNWTRRSSAKNAAEGTYEAIRLATTYAKPDTAEAAEQFVLDQLAKRRSWTRTSPGSFRVTWANRTADIEVARPIDYCRFFQDVTFAEISVFCSTADDDEMAALQEIGRVELRRLFERDAIVWKD